MNKVIREIAEKSGYDISHTDSQYNGHIMRNLLEKYFGKERTFPHK